ncbi:hypothetical protein RvY_02556-2 [Ramazzottius varieornatus]|uniref:Uncharacterized protein n=1 Tax=Ramazzottius varieornatus TaxID=947166 RepID=A0A1D1US68_RAMVA|nr:hypothetical protein RvY_02556-2 [Ramazzottius varieornatus]
MLSRPVGNHSRTVASSMWKANLIARKTGNRYEISKNTRTNYHKQLLRQDLKHTECILYVFNPQVFHTYQICLSLHSRLNLLCVVVQCSVTERGRMKL